jgi:uncharacterized membrane protein
MLLRDPAMDALNGPGIYCWHEHRAERDRRGRAAMNRLLEWVTLATALGCGLSAGAFFAFSAFVMPALARLPAAQAIAAMQSINKLAVTPAFMTAVFGTALACAGLAVWSVVAWDQRSAPLVLAGSAVYLAGTIVVTMAANVPLNNALAIIRPDEAGAAGQWSGYLSRWVAWNHVRAAAALTAAALLAVALRLS